MSEKNVQNISECLTVLNKPSALYKPTLSRDGNQWCALLGVNLVEGVAGFGSTPGSAMDDFDRNWWRP